MPDDIAEGLAVGVGFAREIAESADMVGERGGDLLPPTGQLDEQHLQIGTGNDATGIFIGSGGILQGDNDVVERYDPFVTQHDCPPSARGLRYRVQKPTARSEEHTSELQSLMRNS